MSEDDGWADFRADAKQARLGKHLEALSRICVPSLRLIPDEASRARTHLGGLASVPADFTWPKSSTGEPLGFVAHVDLEEIHALGLAGANVLPPRGVLAFFHGYEPSPNGKHPGNAGRVFHFEGEVAKVESQGERLPEIRLRLEVQTEELPPLESPFYPLMLPNEKHPIRRAPEVFGDFVESYAQLGVRDEDERPVHRLLGYADPLQADVYACTEGNAHQVPFDRWETLDHLRASTAWRLLLQVDSDPSREVLFGDGGVLSFMIREEDLAARRFDRVWVEWQSH